MYKIEMPVNSHLYLHSDVLVDVAKLERLTNSVL
jgi:hypothetical protein